MITARLTQWLRTHRASTCLLCCRLEYMPLSLYLRNDNGDVSRNRYRDWVIDIRRVNPLEDAASAPCSRHALSSSERAFTRPSSRPRQAAIASIFIAMAASTRCAQDSSSTAWTLPASRVRRSNTPQEGGIGRGPTPAVDPARAPASPGGLWAVATQQCGNEGFALRRIAMVSAARSVQAHAHSLPAIWRRI